MKFLLTFLLFIFLNNCSLNKDSTYWTEDSINPGQKQFIKKNNKRKLPKILEKSDDIRNMTIDEYKIYIDDYTKKSKFPDINK